MKGFFYVSLLLGILKEVTESSLKQKADSDEEVATLFDMVQKVFQKMLECMAWSFKKKPEEGLRVLNVFTGWGGETSDGRAVLTGRARGVHLLSCRLLALACVTGLLGQVQSGGGDSACCHLRSTCQPSQISMAHSGV